MIESIAENIFFEKGYNKGYADCQENMAKEYEKLSTWNYILNKVPSMDDFLFLYVQEDNWQGTGFYLGQDKELKEENNYIFGGCAGMITGEITHWMIAPEPPKTKQEPYPW